MKKLINAAQNKITAIILSACILAQYCAPSFAYAGEFLTESYNVSGAGFSWQGLDAEQISVISEKINTAYEMGESGNIYEQALISAEKAELNKIANSAQAKALAAAVKNAKTAYGDMWPMYIKATQNKNITALEKDLHTFLAMWLQEPQAIPFKQFDEEYAAYAAKLAEELSSKTKPPYKQNSAALKMEILSAYPAKTAYKEYLKEAEAEKAWRKANKAKTEQSIYNITRAYIKAIGAQALSLESAVILKDLTLNGKKALSAEESKAIYGYAVSRLEKQDLSAFELNILSNESKKKVARVLAKDLTETLILGAAFAQAGDARFLSAAENIIYRSEDGLAFGQILAAAFAAILAKDGYSNIERILAKYTKEEQAGASLLEKINLSYWAEQIEQSGGKYLGKVSEKTEYALTHSYGNVFTDLAKILSEDGRSRSLGILYRYGAGHKNPIKPFLAGALLSKRTGAKEDFSAKAALALANTDFGDLNAIQEYDLDKGLSLRYPAITKDFGKYAIANQTAKTQKEQRKGAYGYLKRAAFSGDIVLTIWGCVGLVKLGGKAASLTKSAYTAVKASKISSNAARLSFIKANYTALAPYISAKRSFLRLGINIRKGIGLKVNPVQAAKLQKDLRVKNIARLAEQNEAAALKAAESPTPKNTARAELAQSAYQAAALQEDYLLSSRLYGQSYNLKVSSYMEKARQWQAGALSQAPAEPLFTAGEQNFLELSGKLKSALSRYNAAKSEYNGLKWYNKNLINPLKTWWNAPSYGYTLGISELETGKGITLAEAFGLKSTYKGFTLKPSLPISEPAPLRRAPAFYNWLDSHHLGFASKGIKFATNRATLLGTTLLFNYNIATANPAALTAFRTAAATEKVYTLAEMPAQTAKVFTLNAAELARTPQLLEFSTLKPVDAVDPKFFKFYGTLPLPSGSYFNGGAASWITNAASALKTSAQAAILPSFFFGGFRGAASGSKQGGSPFSLQGLRSGFAGTLPAFKKGLSSVNGFLFGKKDPHPKASSFIFNFLAATTVTATAPMISQVYGLDINTTNTIISLLSYLPAMSTPFMGYFFSKYGVNNVAKAASVGTALGVGLTMLGGLNGFTETGTTLGLAAALAGITLMSLSNEMKYASIFPMIDTNFDARTALSLTTQTTMARSAGTILFLEAGPLINSLTQNIGLGSFNNSITFPILIAPLSFMALRSMMKGNYKEVSVPAQNSLKQGLKSVADLLFKDQEARKAAVAFTFMEAAELTTSLLVFSMAQEHYGVLSDMPNVLGGILIYSAMAAARAICGELQKRGILSSDNTFKLSTALSLGGLGTFLVGGISPLGLTGATIFFLGEANLFPPLLNTTLKGRGEKAANTTLLIFSLSSLAAAGGTILGIVSTITGSLQAAIIVPMAFIGGAMVLAKSIFAAKAEPKLEHSFDLETSVVYVKGEKAPEAEENAAEQNVGGETSAQPEAAELQPQTEE